MKPAYKMISPTLSKKIKPANVPSAWSVYLLKYWILIFRTIEPAGEITVSLFLELGPFFSICVCERSL